ncbi:MAG TPA: sigma 54-interacting transcriptional regulator [Vicinamibacterales bacterium]|nr:sigma 54-interacting transcriptional regulator [Vicinamibacterales bacterium]
MAVLTPSSRDRQDALRSRDQLRLLLEVCDAVASHGDLTALFRDLARRLPTIVPFEVIALFLHDPVKNVMRLHMLGTADADRIPPGMEFDIEQSYSGEVFRTQKPVVVRNPAEAARFPHSSGIIRDIGVESFCILPLTTIVRPLGAIAFGSRHPFAFGDEEMDFLGLVARQVAVAVDNVLHDESDRGARVELAQERDRLRLLLEVSESIASYRDLRQLFDELSRRLPRVVPFDFINLVLHDPATDVMRLELLATEQPTTIHPGYETPMDESPAGLVLKTQRPLMIPDLQNERRFPRLGAALLENGVRAYCAVPLTTALRPLGAMAFGSLQPNKYEDADLAFMMHVANQVAVAVDNVLHDKSAAEAQGQLKRDRDRLQLLLEVNNTVVSHLGMEEMFVAISGSLARAIQHDGCSLLLYDADTQKYRVHVLKPDGNQFIEEGLSEKAMMCPAGHTLECREPTILTEADLRRMARESEMAQKLVDHGIKSFCSVPLLSRDRQLGTLNVGRLCDTVFTADEVELLGQVAQQVAIGVENSLAYRKIAELTEKLNKEKLYLEEEIRTNYNFEEIIGDSPAIRETLQKIVIVAPTDSTVLIQGETGTGKELIARAIHNLSGRKARTFVKLNCAAIPTGLLESELFGHEKGAFTGAIAQKVGRFELANGGTLFLDEVGDIPLELQSKFLRVLQEQEFERLGGTKTIKVNVRLVAATNRDLSAMVAAKEFRSDLYYRLNVFPIVNPPLRDRGEDVRKLVQHFTQKFARRMNKRIDSVPADTMSTLSRYHWPGNIRELENFIERAVILTRGSSLDAPLGELERRVEDPVETAAPATTLEAAERDHIRRALEQSNWLVGGPSGAAARLGMKRTTLQSRMKKLGIEKDQVRS